MPTSKSIDELIGLPSVERLTAFIKEDRLFSCENSYGAHRLADWLEKNDTRRALIEAMLPVFVAAMTSPCDELSCGYTDEVQRARAEVFRSLDAETLKALGVL